jgi:hypothetical protein
VEACVSLLIFSFVMMEFKSNDVELVSVQTVKEFKKLCKSNILCEERTQTLVDRWDRDSRIAMDRPILLAYLHQISKTTALHNVVLQTLSKPTISAQIPILLPMSQVSSRSEFSLTIWCTKYEDPTKICTHIPVLVHEVDKLPSTTEAKSDITEKGAVFDRCQWILFVYKSCHHVCVLVTLPSSPNCIMSLFIGPNETAQAKLQMEFVEATNVQK